MTIRRAGPTDWPLMRELRLRALADSPRSFGRSLAEEQAFGEQVWRDRVAPSDDRAWFVDERGGTAVGMYDPDTRIAYVGGMWVAPELRRAGLGRALLEAVLDWARERGATRVELEVNGGTLPALRLYESAGFTRTGNERPLPSDATQAAVELALELLPR